MTAAQKAEAILAVVSDHFEVPVRRLIVRDRQHHVARARMVAMLLMRLSGHTYPAIGLALGGRHHATVIHGCDVAEKVPELLAAALDIGKALGIVRPTSPVEGHP